MKSFKKHPQKGKKKNGKARDDRRGNERREERQETMRILNTRIKHLRFFIKNLLQKFTKNWVDF